MIVYEPKMHVADADLVDLGDPAGLGGRVLEGSPRIAARFDFDEGGMTAGIFQATTGVVEITFPFTEHATILEGEVAITGADGETQVFRRGDSYLIRQGEVVVWEVRGARMRKSFFNRVEP
jgi:hypothetical protein